VIKSAKRRWFGIKSAKRRWFCIKSAKRRWFCIKSAKRRWFCIKSAKRRWCTTGPLRRLGPSCRAPHRTGTWDSWRKPGTVVLLSMRASQRYIASRPKLSCSADLTGCSKTGLSSSNAMWCKCDEHRVGLASPVDEAVPNGVLSTSNTRSVPSSTTFHVTCKMCCKRGGRVATGRLWVEHVGEAEILRDEGVGMGSLTAFGHPAGRSRDLYRRAWAPGEWRLGFLAKHGFG